MPGRSFNPLAETWRRRSNPIRVALMTVLLVAVFGSSCTGPATITRRLQWLAPPLPGVMAHGVLITPTGVVAPILAADATGAWVRTPCFRLAWLRRGVRIERADVVIDPGHGGPELGAVGPNGLAEKEPNLDISQRVGEQLQGDGRSVVFTRLNDATYVTIRTRAEIARALQPAVVLSIHHNAAGPPPRPGRPGSQVFHQATSTASRNLGALLATEIVLELSRFDIEWSNDDGPALRTRVSEETGLDYYGILRYDGSIPTVLTESAFLSNAAEAELLATDAFRRAEVDAIVRGTRAYLGDPLLHLERAPNALEPFPLEPPSDAVGCVDPLLA